MRGVVFILVTLLPATLPGCACIGTCNTSSDSFWAFAPGLFEALERNGTKEAFFSTHIGEAPDWIVEVGRRPEANVTVRVEHRSFETDVLTVRWKAGSSEQRAQNFALGFAAMADYPFVRIASNWKPTCAAASCWHTESFERRSFVPLLQAALRADAAVWERELPASQSGAVGAWTFRFEYKQLEAEVTSGAYTVQMVSSASGMTEFSVQWADGSRARMSRDQGLEAGRLALASLGLDPNALREIYFPEVLPPPAARAAT